MTLQAFENGTTVLNQDNMNALLSAQPSSLIFDGTLTDSKTGAGATQNDGSVYDFAARFTLTGQTTIGRVEIDLSGEGVASNLTIEIRDSTFSTTGSSDGVLKGSVTIPKKMIPAAQAYLSIPMNITGLTAGAQYWIIVKKAGDAANHLHWFGEDAQDASYPAYQRSGTTGAWTIKSALHFKVYAKTAGTYQLIHGIYGTNAKTLIVWNAGQISYVWRWLTGPSGTFLICDKLTPTYDGGGVATDWTVT